MAVAFGIISSDIGTNYGQTYTSAEYTQISAQTAKITDAANRTSESVIGTDTGQSNILTSSERLVTGAYNAILVMADIPGIYTGIINVVTTVLGIPQAITTLLLAAIIFIIITAIIYLALGRV